MSSVIIAVDANHGPSKNFHGLSAASTNKTSVRATSTTLVYGSISNTSAAVKYLKLYDKSTVPSLPTDAPKLTIMVPANQRVEINGGVAGLRFPSGLAFAATALPTDADSTAVGAGDLIVDLWYE